MKNTSGTLGLRRKKSPRLGLLLLSTLFIIVVSALVYGSMVYEKALDVGNTGGVTTGSTALAEVSFTPAAIMMVVVAVLVVGLSMFGFLREASKHARNAPGGRGSAPTGPVSMSLEVPGIDLPLNPPSTQGEEWEESSTKKKNRK